MGHRFVAAVLATCLVCAQACAPARVHSGSSQASGDDAGANAICGDDICQDGESPDSCSADCPRCGNGALEPGELCDDGFTDPCGSCNADCSAVGKPAVCGDGEICPEEEACDDGYSDDCGSCNADCSGPGTASLGTCGDGIRCQEGGEACDDGFTDACGTCNEDCTGAGTGALCGDGETCPENESCDDGFTDACGTCNADCSAAGEGSACGDNETCAEWEACDDGNTTTETDCPYDTPSCVLCNATCDAELELVGAFCGDGVQDPGESCDDGYRDQCGLCNEDCSGAGTGDLGVCGDGIWCEASGEACDDGDLEVCGGCNADCSGAGAGAITCGDGVRCGTEECDANGDSPTCTVDCTRKPTMVVAGLYHTCALLGSGGVKCWGSDLYGQLGDGGANTAKNVPVDVVGLASGVTSIGAGRNHTCAVTEAGALLCWGSDYNGQLGDGGANTDSGTPVSVVGLGSDVSAVALGSDHTCALTGAGAVKCWGGDAQSQLGDGGSDTDQTAPVDVVGLAAGVAAIAAGDAHTCALLDAGAVECWGDDDDGQLGDSGTNTDQSTPVPVSGLDTGVAAVVAGFAHSCALLSTGAVTCWGGDEYEQLGDGTGSVGQDTPVAVTGLADGVVELAAGNDHTCARLATGALSCWGRDDYSQLGDGGANTHQAVPVGVTNLTGDILHIATGGFHTCVMLETAAVKCWGADNEGQLGDGATLTASDSPVPVAGLDDIVAIAAGRSHTCALSATGTLWCWGDSFYGQTGAGWPGTDQNLPVDVLGLGANVETFATGVSHTCAVLTTGALKCWGSDFYDQLGNAATNQGGPSPIQVEGLASGVAAVAAGDRHTCALLGTGAVRCWGNDFHGQLGDGGAATNQATPVDVVGLASGVSALAAGVSHACGLLGSGAIKCWGYDGYGQLGDGGTNANQDTPVETIALSSIVDQIGASGQVTCARLDTTALYCWGRDVHGQLGDGGTNTDQGSPVPVVGLGSGVASVSPGGGTLVNGHSCAVLMDGEVRCWGRDGDGQLGDGGAHTNQAVPVAVVGLSGKAVAVAAGDAHTCALLETGSVECWGSDSDGQLGDDHRWGPGHSNLPVGVVGIP